MYAGCIGGNTSGMSICDRGTCELYSGQNGVSVAQKLYLFDKQNLEDAACGDVKRYFFRGSTSEGSSALQSHSHIDLTA